MERSENNVVLPETSLNRDALAHIQQVLTQTPIDPSDSRYGALHGMSAESVVRLLITGNIPGKTGRNKTDKTQEYRIGDLFVHPIGISAQGTELETGEAQDYIMETTTKYAHITATQRAFIEALANVSQGEKVERIFANIAPIDEEEITKIFLTRLGIGSFSIEEAKKLYRQAEEERRGFLVALDPSVYEDFPTLDGDDIYDKVLRTGNGLPYKYILALYPLGPYEMEVAHQIQSIVAS